MSKYNTVILKYQGPHQTIENLMQINKKTSSKIAVNPLTCRIYLFIRVK